MVWIAHSLIKLTLNSILTNKFSLYTIFNCSLSVSGKSMVWQKYFTNFCTFVPKEQENKQTHTQTNTCKNKMKMKMGTSQLKYISEIIELPFNYIIDC